MNGMSIAIRRVPMPKRARLARVVERVARRQERLARHAAAQNAQAAERPVVDERHVAADVARRSRGRIAGGTGADDDQVVTVGTSLAITARAGGRRAGASIR